MSQAPEQAHQPTTAARTQQIVSRWDSTKVLFECEGRCACLVGTIAHARVEAYTALGNGLEPDSSRPAERFFLSIAEGDTPETNAVSKIVVEWIDDFSALLVNATAQVAA